MLEYWSKLVKPLVQRFFDLLDQNRSIIFDIELIGLVSGDLEGFMNRHFRVHFLTFGLIAAVFVGQGFGQSTSTPISADAAYDSVVTILLASDGESRAVGSGVIVRSDGYVMTTLGMVRDAAEVQVRLRNGETFDNATIVSRDERRNVAILKINAANLRVMPFGSAEESQVGSRVFLFANPDGRSVSTNNVMLSSVMMADAIAGAGKGYRVLELDASLTGNTAGGLLIDARGQAIGMMTTQPGMQKQIAVPMSSLVGLVRSIQTGVVSTGAYGVATATAPAPSQTPVPIPQNSVLVPQRGVTPLPPRGPGSVVVKPSSVPEILAASKTIYVQSRTVSFKPEQMINALNKRNEMREWGLTFVDERGLADLVLELDHVLFTWKYTFKLYSQRLGTVVATGNNIIWDGNIGADDMANRFIEKVKVARGTAQPATAPAATESKKTDDK